MSENRCPIKDFPHENLYIQKGIQLRKALPEKGYLKMNVGSILIIRLSSRYRKGSGNRTSNSPFQGVHSSVEPLTASSSFTATLDFNRLAQKHPNNIFLKTFLQENGDWWVPF